MVSWEQRVERRHHSPRDYLDAARSQDADADLLSALAKLPFTFVQKAVAEHPNTRSGTLLELVPDEMTSWADQALLSKIAKHPAADSAVLAAVTTTVGAALTVGQRPYSVAIVLVERGALSASGVERLGRLPGASARLRHGLRRALPDTDGTET